MRHALVVGMVLFGCTLLLAQPIAADPDVWATGTAWLSTDPGYIGFWKYCYEVCWIGLPHGVSHVDVVLCLLADCECVCEPGYFAFADTVGSGPGTPNGEPCTVYYYGLFECNGDPSIGVELPVLKFEPFESDCEPDVEGCAYVCFYSVAAPITGTYCDFTAIKYGQEFAVGDIEGVLPSCDTDYSGVAASTWSGIKAIYR